jgi:vitamin B12 transporter
MPKSLSHTQLYPKVSFLTAANLLALFGTNALAQNVTLLPETIVSASAISQEAKNIGSTVAVIDQGEIEKRQLHRLSDALELLPGVSVANSGTNGLASIFVRGHSSSDVLVLVDGVKMNDPSSGSGAFDASYLSLSNIERIEFIKGAQSAIWGSSAVAGVINIITKSATKDGISASGYVEVGSESFLSTGGSISFKNKNNSGSITLSKKSTDGISAAAGGTEQDPYDNKSIFLKGHSQINENFSIGASAQQQKSETDYDNPPNDTDSYTDATVSTYQVYANYDINNLTNKIYYNSSETKRFSHDASFGDTNFKGRAQAIGYIGSVDFGSELAAQKLISRIEKNKESVNSDSNFSPADKSNDTLELALEHTAELSNGLSTSAALRYQDNDIFGDDLTYKVSLSHENNFNGRAHASFGTSVKNPSLTQLYAPSSGNLSLKPQTSESFDIGYEARFLDDNLIIDSTYFNSKVDNLFGFDSNFQNTNTEGTTKRTGIEISARGNLNDQTRINAAYTYTKATDADGNTEIRRPKHALDIGANYDVNNKLTVGANLQYRGKNYDNDFSSFPAETVKLDDYTLLNINANYKLNNNIDVYGRIDNITDEDYQEVLNYGTQGRSYYLGIKADY